MGKDLAQKFEAAKQIFEEADAALAFALSDLCFNGPAEDLQLTENTQPAILATSIAAQSRTGGRVREIMRRTTVRAVIAAFLLAVGVAACSGCGESSSKASRTSSNPNLEAANGPLVGEPQKLQRRAVG